MSYSYRPMYWACISKLSFIEKTNQLWKISFVGGLLNVSLNLIFIPIYGFEAAALTTLISLLYIGFAGFFLKDFKDNNLINYYPLRWLIIIIASTIIVYFLRDIYILNKIIITGIIFILFILYFLKMKNKLNDIAI